MRKIYNPSWSGAGSGSGNSSVVVTKNGNSSNNSHHYTSSRSNKSSPRPSVSDNKMKLLSASTSSEEEEVMHDSVVSKSPNGVMDSSSFDRNSSRKTTSNTRHQLPQEQETDPVHFVPAYHQTSPINKKTQQQQHQPQQDYETSWDAIAEDTTNTSPSNNGTRYSQSAVETTTQRRNTSSSMSSSGGGLHHHQSRNNNRSKGPRNYCFSSSSPTTQHYRLSSSTTSANVEHRTKQQQKEETKSVSGVTSSSRGGGTSRIARLASLFSSRAVVPTTTNKNENPVEEETPASFNNNEIIPSPPASESSSGYIAWPGTQDKRGGGTVVVESSYEESDINNEESSSLDRVPTMVSSGSTNGGVGVGTSPSPARLYQQQVQEAVDREVNSWMKDGDITAVDSVSDTSSPVRTTTLTTSTNVEKTKTPPRPFVSARAEREKIHRLSSVPTRSFVEKNPSLLDRPVQSIKEVYGRGDSFGAIKGEDNNDRSKSSDDHNYHIATTSNMADPWEEPMSDLSTSYSKTSSAYFNPREVQAIRKGRMEQLSSVRQNPMAVAAAVMRRYQSPAKGGYPQQHMSDSTNQSQPLTEETLAMKDRFSPPHRVFNAANTTGFKGLLDKTQDMPNLMDDVESDTTSAISGATSRHSSAISGAYSSRSSYRNRNNGIYGRAASALYKQQQQQSVIMEESNISGLTGREETESDIFDGVSNVDEPKARPRKGINNNTGEGEGILGATSRAAMEKINLALLGGGLTTIQTTSEDFTNRKTASDFDETLTNSDCDQYGYTKIPAIHEMAAAGMSQHDRSLSSQSLLFAQLTRPLSRPVSGKVSKAAGSESGLSFFADHYPTEGLGKNVAKDLSQYYVDPEEMKILVKKFRKMSRDRYPHLDYEDLEREEDATKTFALSEMRSRIMETDIERGLERRGGTTIVDDIVMTSYGKAALRVRDAIIVAKAWRDGATPQDVINTSLLTRRAERAYYIPRLEKSARGASRYTWEEVTWVDDMELSQYRCHSIGPRHLKGVEMFTIGDCQSILLKLCNDRCVELRIELNEATARQIDAEESMKQEGETFVDGTMTEAEMTYLSAMEEVKNISIKLVLAEKAFNLVKDRIEKLVAKYEALLVRFETETDSVAPSSVFTYESSYYSDDYSYATAEEREKEALARRAQRAELRAELAAREALLAKQQARKVREEKEKELTALRNKLADLQSESSAAITEKEHSVVLARAITANSRNGGTTRNASAGNTNGTTTRISRSKIDDVKQRFRDRNASKFTVNGGRNGTASQSNQNANNNSNSLYRTVGEEMFQHLDFYERSLKAVEG